MYFNVACTHFGLAQYYKYYMYSDEKNSFGVAVNRVYDTCFRNGLVMGYADCKCSLSPVTTKLRKGDIGFNTLRPSVRQSVSPSVRLE